MEEEVEEEKVEEEVEEEKVVGCRCEVRTGSGGSSLPCRLGKELSREPAPTW